MRATIVSKQENLEKEEGPVEYYEVLENVSVVKVLTHGIVIQERESHTFIPWHRVYEISDYQEN